MRSLVIENESCGAVQRKPLKVEAVLVQRIPMDEHHGDIAPRGGAVCVLDLHVKLDPVGATNNLWVTSQLTKPEPSARCDSLSKPSPHDDSLGGKPGRSPYSGGEQGDAGNRRTLSGVHWPAPPR
jgi:hypothetical protein